MSSAAFTEDNEDKRPTVQVGDPFTEKLLLEAWLELFKEDLIIGIQDMGAAGLTSSSFEMAGRSGSGMRMDLDKVPAREEGMTPYDFMLSESQERMLICAKKGCEQAVIDIFEKWELSVAVIGEVTDTGNMELYWHGEKCADIPIQPLSEEAPILDRPVKKPAYLKNIQDVTLDKELAFQTIFDKLWSSIEVVDKSWIYDQYDSMVQTNTVKGPGKLDGSVIRIKENGKALAMSADCNTRYCYINPELGAAAAVMEAGRNVAMSGARPLAATDCLNFGNPEDPEVMWQFMKACDGIKSACKELNTPIIGGNVSLYNETNGVGIFPTPAIATVGVNDDMNNVLPSHFQAEGNYICILGDTYSEFGGSLLLKEIYGKVAGTHPVVDFKKELSLWDTVIEANKLNLLESAKDINIGGIAISAAKMAVVGNIGCDIRVALENEQDIFSESLSRAIVEIKPQNIEAFDKLASSMGITYVSAGKTGGDTFSVNNLYKKLNTISDIYFNKFKEVIEQDL
jgi:phosphoribosylformylglycinamidine synthase